MTAALIVVVIGAVLFHGSKVIFQVVSYRRSGHQMKDWHPEAFFGTEGVGFQLRRDWDTSRAIASKPEDFGTMQCIVKTPTGESVVLQHQDFVFIYHTRILVNCPRTAEGAYEVRWYGSTPRGHFYELCRGRFTRTGISEDWEPTG